jgi:hypothetical protein
MSTRWRIGLDLRTINRSPGADFNTALAQECIAPETLSADWLAALSGTGQKLHAVTRQMV